MLRPHAAQHMQHAQHEKPHMQGCTHPRPPGPPGWPGTGRARAPRGCTQGPAPARRPLAPPTCAARRKQRRVRSQLPAHWEAQGARSQLGSGMRHRRRVLACTAHLYICTRLLMPARSRPWNSAAGLGKRSTKVSTHSWEHEGGVCICGPARCCPALLLHTPNARPPWPVPHPPVSAYTAPRVSFSQTTLNLPPTAASTKMRPCAARGRVGPIYRNRTISGAPEGSWLHRRLVQPAWQGH